MRIKIRRKFIRLRLNSNEIQQLKNQGFVETVKRIGRNSSEKLKYTIEQWNYSEIQILYALDQMRILVPACQINPFVCGELKSINETIPGLEIPFKIKIERQFDPAFQTKRFLQEKSKTKVYNIFFPPLRPI